LRDGEGGHRGVGAPRDRNVERTSALTEDLVFGDPEKSLAALVPE